MDKLQSAFVKSTLLSNVSVTIKQAASYSTAGLYLSQRALAPYQGTIARLFGNNDSKFARDLYNYALEDAHENLLLIDKNADNWQVDRMALMDKVIMVCALAEIKHFPEIAVRISMNEYIELAKHYCAPDSARFVNGILDKIIKQWKKDGVIFKA